MVNLVENKTRSSLWVRSQPLLASFISSVSSEDYAELTARESPLPYANVVESQKRPHSQYRSCHISTPLKPLKRRKSQFYLRRHADYRSKQYRYRDKHSAKVNCPHQSPYRQYSQHAVLGQPTVLAISRQNAHLQVHPAISPPKKYFTCSIDPCIATVRRQRGHAREEPLPAGFRPPTSKPTSTDPGLFSRLVTCAAARALAVYVLVDGYCGSCPRLEAPVVLLEDASAE